MGEPRRQKNVRRISGHAAPGDPVLHDVHGTGDGAEDARRVVCGGFVFAEQRGAVLPDGHGDTFHEISLALFIFFRLFLGGVPPDELAVQVDGEDDVRPKRTANGNRHGIDQPAVKQPAVMIKDGREQTGKGDGRPDRFFKRAFLQPVFPAGAHLRGDGGIAHGQIFDEHTRRGHTVREEGTEFFLIHKPIDGHAEIEVRRRIEFGQRAHALLQPTKVSGGVRRAHNRTDGRPAHDFGVDVQLRECFNDAYMRPAPCGAAPQRQSYFHGRPPLCIFDPARRRAGWMRVF